MLKKSIVYLNSKSKVTKNKKQKSIDWIRRHWLTKPFQPTCAKTPELNQERNFKIRKFIILNIFKKSYSADRVFFCPLRLDITSFSKKKFLPFNLEIKKRSDTRTKALIFSSRFFRHIQTFCFIAGAIEY